jgi:hypothetical protein
MQPALVMRSMVWGGGCQRTSQALLPGVVTSSWLGHTRTVNIAATIDAERRQVLLFLGQRCFVWYIPILAMLHVLLVGTSEDRDRLPLYQYIHQFSSI